MPKKRRKRNPFEELIGVNVGQWGGVASAFLAGLETMAGPQKRIIDQLSQFATHFTRSALERWPGQTLQEAACVMQDCGGEAVLRCLACGQPVCLAHIHVSHRAEGVCDQCVRDLVHMKGAEAPRAGRAPTATEIRKALKTLGLRSGASWQQIQRAHRKLAAQYHPDRAPSDTARGMLEDRVKRINVAFEVLRVHHERDAA
jgi:DnaJ-domain-containing protein 1